MVKKPYIHLLEIILIMTLSLLTTGCYILSQSGTFLADRISTRSFKQVLSDPAVSDETRMFLKEVERINDFATRYAGLKASKNYTVYRNLNRDHLAYIVYGAGRFSFEKHMWDFPIVGSLPYKGFFKLSGAKKEQQKLIDQKYDTWISIVDGFSSLGFFKDPLYSSMQEYSPYHLANLICHERTHATIWVKNQIDFNEQLASFIGEKAAEAYVRRNYGGESTEYTDIFKQKHDQELFIQAVFNLRTQLTTLYKNTALSEPARLKEKERIISEFKIRFAENHDKDYLTDQYSRIAELPINNAFIAIYGVYYERMDLFSDIYTYCGEDLKTMIELLQSFDGTEEDPVPTLQELIASNLSQ